MENENGGKSGFSCDIAVVREVAREILNRLNSLLKNKRIPPDEQSRAQEVLIGAKVSPVTALNAIVDLFLKIEQVEVGPGSAERVSTGVFKESDFVLVEEYVAKVKCQTTTETKLS